MLVDTPARVLKGGPLKVFVALVVLAALLAFTVAAPEMVALLGVADLSLYLDLAVLSAILGAADAVVAAGRRVAAPTMQLAARLDLAPGRSRRSGTRTRRVRRPQRPSSNDDASPAGDWALAMAA